MNRLHYSPEALSDLDEIWKYISKEFQNPAAALNMIDDILDTIDKLREFSEIGPSLSSVTGIESDYRGFTLPGLREKAPCNLPGKQAVELNRYKDTCKGGTIV